MSKRMTDESRRALIQAYRAWQPGSGVTLDQLVHQHGTTKSTLYNILESEGEPLHTKRPSREQSSRSQEPLMAEMGRLALGVILDQRDEYRAKVAELTEEVTRLRRLLRDHGFDPGEAL